MPEKRTGVFVRQQDPVTKQERFLPTTGPVGLNKPAIRSNVAWPIGDPAGRPALVEFPPDGGTPHLLAYQSSRDFTATVTHSDGSQELVLVPAQYSAGTEGTPAQAGRGA